MKIAALFITAFLIIHFDRAHADDVFLTEISAQPLGQKITLQDLKDKVVVIDFWASWCGPCRMAAPHVAQTARELAGRAVVVKVDTERFPSLAAQYNVRSIPNFAVFSGGQLQFQQAGLVDAATMESWLTRAA